jgi:hypothetical protein
MQNVDTTPGLGSPHPTAEKGEVDGLMHDLRNFNDEVREKAVIRLAVRRARGC